MILCLQAGGGCVNDPANGQLTCAAKEVTAAYSASAPPLSSCVLDQDETIEVEVELVIDFNTERYDVAYYVAKDGGNGLSGT